MNAPIYSLARADPEVLTLLGSPNPRFYAFGNAPQKGTSLYALPYAVWQTVYGAPENYVNERPDMDNWGYQVDAYASSMQQARNVLMALRDALEGAAHIVSWGTEEREDATNLYRANFTIEFWTARAVVAPASTTLALSGDESGNTLILSGSAQSTGSDSLVI